MPHVLVISYDFPPSVEIGAHACEQIVRHLPRYDWQPVVLTIGKRCIDPARIDRHFSRPFPGLIHRTRVLPHPLDLYRLFKSGAPSQPAASSEDGPAERKRTSVRNWALSLLLLPDMYSGWILPAVAAGIRLVRREQITHLFSTAPCWSNHVIGLLLHRLTGLPWTAHFRDPWTQDRHWRPTSALSTRLESALERAVMRRATSIVCVTEAHSALLRRTYPDLPSHKFVTIPNGFDEAEWAAVAPRGEVPVEKFTITYAGSLWQRRNPLPLFLALQTLAKTGEIDLAKVQVDLIGWCEEAEGQRVSAIAAECGLGRCVRLTGPLSRSVVLERLVRSDLLLLLAEGWTLQIPGKTYEYLRAGRPILALTTEGALADLLRRTGGGWVVDPADGPGIVAAVANAYRCWEQGGSPVADQRLVKSFDRRVLAGRFADLFTLDISGVAA